MEEVEIFENVTKVETFLAFDMFENTIKIFQGKKVTKIKQHEIVEFTVE
jgi:hypothetical protein